MTQPRRAHDAYAGVHSINSACPMPMKVIVSYQSESDPLAKIARGDKSPGQPGYKAAGWYWTRCTKWGGPYTSSRAAFRAAVAALTR